MADDDSEQRPLLPDRRWTETGRTSTSAHTFGHRQSDSQVATITGGNPTAETNHDTVTGTSTTTTSWREWTAERLESPITHKIILTLIAIDAVCVLADLSYTFLSPERDCSNPNSDLGLLRNVRTNSASHFIARHFQDSTLVEEEDPKWLDVLSYISLTITALFVLEIPLSLWCFGIRYYLPFNLDFLSRREPAGVVLGRDIEGEAEAGVRRASDGVRDADAVERQDSDTTKPKLVKTPSQSKTKTSTPSWQPYSALHLFDAFVVLTTFILEFVLRGRERELAGLLVLLRLWRLVKLVGGLAVGAGEIQEELSEGLEKAQRRIKELEAENERLRNRLQVGEGSPSLLVDGPRAEGDNEES